MLCSCSVLVLAASAELERTSEIRLHDQVLTFLTLVVQIVGSKPFLRGYHGACRQFVMSQKVCIADMRACGGGMQLVQLGRDARPLQAVLKLAIDRMAYLHHQVCIPHVGSCIPF